MCIRSCRASEARLQGSCLALLVAFEPPAFLRANGRRRSCGGLASHPLLAALGVRGLLWFPARPVGFSTNRHVLSYSFPKTGSRRFLPAWPILADCTSKSMALCEENPGEGPGLSCVERLRHAECLAHCKGVSLNNLTKLLLGGRHVVKL